MQYAMMHAKKLNFKAFWGQLYVHTVCTVIPFIIFFILLVLKYITMFGLLSCHENWTS